LHARQLDAFKEIISSGESARVRRSQQDEHGTSHYSHEEKIDFDGLSPVTLPDPGTLGCW